MCAFSLVSTIIHSPALRHEHEGAMFGSSCFAIDECVPIEIEDWTDDETTSSSDSDAFLEDLHRASTPKVPVKTEELYIEDLPQIEELSISVEENELTKIGKIHAIVTKQVIVQALKDQKPLDMDSVIFLAADKPLGRVFEVFGPVVEPFYIVLFNSPEDIVDKGVTLDADVYFAPEKKDITTYIFVDVLRRQKGSDASWKNNDEPPEEHLDYSDDEQERAAKLKRLGKNRNREDDDVQIISKRGCSSNKMSPGGPAGGWGQDYGMQRYGGYGNQGYGGYGNQGYGGGYGDYGGGYGGYSSGYGGPGYGSYNYNGWSGYGQNGYSGGYGDYSHKR